MDEEKRIKIFWHADDFGISVNQSKIIWECVENGMLNSLSVIPNSKFIKECKQEIKCIDKTVRVGIHLNLLEGRCCANPNEIPLLIDGEGIMKQSFLSLLFHSCGWKKREYTRQIKKELQAQIETFLKYYHVEKLNIDSHNHFHMLPIVCNALVELICEEGY